MVGDLRQDKRNINVPSTGEIFFAGSGVGFSSAVKNDGQIYQDIYFSEIFRISRKTETNYGRPEQNNTAYSV